MSTNYYIKNYLPNDDMNPDWHIGKRYGAGKGKTNFVWAMHPTQLAKRLWDAGFNSDLGGIVDERNEEFNLPAFLKTIVGACEVVEDNRIGEWFS
jgi:hypothetical protein